MSITDKNSRLLQGAQLIIYGGLILYLGRSVLVPIAFAALISFVLYPICKWFERRGMGRMTAVVVSLVLLSIPLLLLVVLFTSQIFQLISEWSLVENGIRGAGQQIVTLLSDQFGVDHDTIDRWITMMTDQVLKGSLGFVSTALTRSASSAIIAIIIPIYVVLILYYRRIWMKVLARLVPGYTADQLQEIVTLTITTYYNFIKGMGIVYLIVGVLNTVGLVIIGIPHAIAFGFIASILTFIPYVGIMIGSLLPIALAWAMHQSIWYPLAVVGVFAVVQYLEANVIFPIAVSNRMKVNTMSVLVAIFAGALLWGVSGMILFVPFVGMIKLIADHTPGGETIGLLLGTDDENQPEKKSPTPV